MNANSYFNSQTGTPRPFDNVNQYAASVGGPIFKNKTFFFGDFEGLRVLIPVTNVVTAQSPNYVSCLTTGLPASGTTTPCAAQTVANLFPFGISQVPASDIPIYNKSWCLPECAGLQYGSSVAQQSNVVNLT